MTERCPHCGMSWIAPRVEPHVCPEPLPPEIARAWASFYINSGQPCHPRDLAAMRLGLGVGK